MAVVLLAASGLADMLTAKYGVGGEHDAVQQAGRLPLAHRFEHLVLDTPGGGIGDAEMELERQCRNDIFAVRVQVNHMESLVPRQLGGVTQDA